jgi:hypothetical protein
MMPATIQNPLNLIQEDPTGDSITSCAADPTKIQPLRYAWTLGRPLDSTCSPEKAFGLFEQLLNPKAMHIGKTIVQKTTIKGCSH